MFLWVDDFAGPPDALWTWVSSYDQAIHHLSSGQVTSISLDHNLLPHHYVQDWSDQKTGANILNWMARTKIIPDQIRIHSIDPYSQSRMIDSLQKLRKVQAKQAV
jgi:hypothetical protein